MKRAFLKSFLFSLAIGAFVRLSSGTAAAADDAADPELRPIVTRYAKTATKVTVTAGFKAFRDIELQEAENFDGLGFDVDVVVPFAKRFQVRLNVPVYTTGHGRLVAPPHRNIDIHGYGGTFDFANVQGDWQFLRQEEHGVNLSVSGGAGMALRYLETSTKDRYNHVGRVALGGVKLDKKLSDAVTIAANAGVRYYWVSDDLNPTGGDDEFTHADLSVAAIFNPFHHTVYPVVELVYAGDFNRYNSILLVPEIIWPICSHFELKAGITYGLTSDGERVGARVQGVVRF